MFLGEKSLFPKGFSCGNLQEIIDLSGIPKFANKKSRISGIFGESFISGIPGSLKSIRNH
jgi:hypothetical protein